jgi:serine protease Do
MGVLDGIQDQIRRVAEQAGTGVVGIGQRWGVGSGVVIGAGQVLTNAHNVRGEQVSITFGDGHTASGRIRGLDVDGDLAVVEVETGDSPAIEWATDGDPGLGTPVFALANPGGRGLRVTLGFVTGVQRSFRGPRGRRITGSVEHDAALLPGSSGGPIVTAEGKLLGVNTNRLGEGFYLAIPADESLRTRVDALASGTSPSRVRLGIGVVPAHVGCGGPSVSLKPTGCWFVSWRTTAQRREPASRRATSSCRRPAVRFATQRICSRRSIRRPTA